MSDIYMAPLARAAYKAILKWKFEDKGGQEDEGEALDGDRGDRNDHIACGCVCEVILLPVLMVVVGLGLCVAAARNLELDEKM